MANELPPRRRRLGLGGVLLLSGAGLILLFVLAIAVGWLRGAQAVEAELARIRAAGEPISPEELEAFYKAPPADIDTTQLWIAALAPLDTPEFEADAKDLPFVGEPQEPIPGESWPQLAVAEQFLVKYREPLTRMHRAAEMGGQARFPVLFADGGMAEIPHLSQLLAGARLLQLESAVAVHREHPDVAIESIATLLSLARSLEQEPLLASQLVRVSLDRLARARVERLLFAFRLDSDQLARLDLELAASEYKKAFRRAMLGERVAGITAFANPATLGPPTRPVRVGLMPNADRTMYLQIMAEVLAALNKTGMARTKAIEHAESRIEQLKSATGASVRYPLTFLLLPTLIFCSKTADRNDAERDSARVALAIERYHLRHGRLTEKLNELVPEFMDRVPIDPFDGASLRYRADAKEYVVYSVGADGIDQGGVAEPGGEMPVDLVFRVQRKDSGQQPDSSTAEPQPK